MCDGAGPYLFDVGPIALAHTEAPVRDAALSYVRAAVAGEIDAVVPFPAVLGAHNVLTTHYGRSVADATRLLGNFLDASEIDWVGQISKSTLQAGIETAARANIDGWDGYYAAVARDAGVETLLTLDHDFVTVDGFETEIVLSPAEFEALDDYLST